MVHTYKLHGNLETASGPYIRLTGFYHPNQDDDDDDDDDGRADRSFPLHHFSIVPGAFLLSNNVILDQFYFVFDQF